MDKANFASAEFFIIVTCVQYTLVKFQLGLRPISSWTSWLLQGWYFWYFCFYLSLFQPQAWPMLDQRYFLQRLILCFCMDHLLHFAQFSHDENIDCLPIWRLSLEISSTLSSTKQICNEKCSTSVESFIFRFKGLRVRTFFRKVFLILYTYAFVSFHFSGTKLFQLPTVKLKLLNFLVSTFYQLRLLSIDSLLPDPYHL